MSNGFYCREIPRRLRGAGGSFIVLGMAEEARTFTYVFRFPGGEEYAHAVSIGASAGDVPPAPANLPDWTRLDFHPCEGCAYTAGERCPVAARLVEPVAALGGRKSFERVDVTVETEARSYRKETDMQQGMSSLFGLIMATSGCPSMEKFRPMAWFHLPFSTLEETLARVVATHVLGRFYRGETLAAPERMAEEIEALYHNILAVNAGIIARLRAAHAAAADSPFNAVVILNAVAAGASLMDEELNSIRDLYRHAAAG